MEFRLYIITLLLFAFVSPVLAQTPIPSLKPLDGRVEVSMRPGTERSIVLTEFWVPIAQNQADGSVIYGDLRLMGDDQNNREFNVGAGYREMVNTALLGDGIIGGHVWYDRRLTERGSEFNQITAGMEWFSDVWDAKINAYYPLNDSKTHTQTNPNGQGAGFVGNQIIVNTDQTIIEEALPGLDLELGWKVPFLDGFTDSTRVYGGVYHFEGDKAENVTGWRTRISSDITQNILLGARFQSEDVRGSQGFLEATIRFPFGNKQSYKKQGLYARLDESPERDIDIVSNEAVTEDGINEVLLNATSGAIQNVIHVDNTNGVGTGTAEDPFNTLAAAEAVAGPNDIIYVHRGDGLTTGQNAGLTIDDEGQMLIGSGSSLRFDGSRFSVGNGSTISGSAAELIAANSLGGPSITNPGGDAIRISADNVLISGIIADGASQRGIFAFNNTNTTWNNISVQNLIAINNTFEGVRFETNGTNSEISNIVARDILVDNNSRTGLLVFANNRSVISGANVSNITATNNGENGIWIYSRFLTDMSNVTVNNLTSNNNGLHGLSVFVNDTGTMRNINVSNANVSDNSTNGMIAFARNAGILEDLNLSKITSNNNINNGILIESRLNNSSLNRLTATHLVANNNQDDGVLIFSNTDGNLDNIKISNMETKDNTLNGIRVSANNNSSFDQTREPLKKTLKEFLLPV